MESAQPPPEEPQPEEQEEGQQPEGGQGSDEAAVEKTKKAMEGEDVQAINASVEELQQASHKLAEAMYQQASAGAGDAAGGPGPEQQADSGGASRPPDEDVVDADFTEVKEDKK